MNVDKEEEEEEQSTNEAADFSSSRKSKKHVRPEESSVLKMLLICELSSDTTRLSEIKEKRGLHREAV
ncbi:hypothetical protein GLOIN_2v1528678 [Rhizophagus clarus]|uniref:Uncharacterized protein n=1 Tax=Rhizophagus clarus TaxID=94130 RepID=A0A8H3LN85_9GLOM|nr:hypothetical protein GLOIN_2v1528678 [Rhizophagus clarus]